MVSSFKQKICLVCFSLVFLTKHLFSFLLFLYNLMFVSNLTSRETYSMARQKACPSKNQNPKHFQEIKPSAIIKCNINYSLKRLFCTAISLSIGHTELTVNQRTDELCKQVQFGRLFQKK